MEMVSVQHSGIKLSASISGAGPAVVFWPSIFTTHKQYVDLAKRLEKSNTVVSFDAPGFGSSEILADNITMDNCVKATMAFLDKYEIQKVTWLGTSWGGVVGTHVAELYPHRIKHLYLLGTPFESENRFKASALSLLTKLMGNTRLYSYVVGMSFFNTGTLKNKSFMREFHQSLNQGDKAQFIRAVELVFKRRESLKELLPFLSEPVTVIAGTDDYAVHRDIQANAADDIPHSKYIELKGRHVVIPDYPVELESILRN